MLHLLNARRHEPLACGEHEYFRWQRGAEAERWLASRCTARAYLRPARRISHLALIALVVRRQSLAESLALQCGLLNHAYGVPVPRAPHNASRVTRLDVQSDVGFSDRDRDNGR
jgi:hypothetical protein